MYQLKLPFYKISQEKQKIELRIKKRRSKHLDPDFIVSRKYLKEKFLLKINLKYGFKRSLRGRGLKRSSFATFKDYDIYR